MNLKLNFFFYFNLYFIEIEYFYLQSMQFRSTFMVPAMAA